MEWFQRYLKENQAELLSSLKGMMVYGGWQRKEITEIEFVLTVSKRTLMTVSYTHLTLPTICSV